jgi:hypothetical protein
MRAGQEGGIILGVKYSMVSTQQRCHQSARWRRGANKPGAERLSVYKEAMGCAGWQMWKETKNPSQQESMKMSWCRDIETTEQKTVVERCEGRDGV